MVDLQREIWKPAWHDITFRPTVTFDDPATPDGRSWNTALKRVCQTQGWSELDWGPRLGHKEVVDLLISWVRHVDLLLFMANEYQAFLKDIRTLLAGEGYSSPLSAPFVVESGMRAVDLGIVSSIYELEVDPAPSADVKIRLHIDIQLCRSLFRAATERLEDGDQFLKMDACWIEEPQQISQFPSPSSQTPSTTQMDQVTLIPGTKLFLMTEWESAAGEIKMLDSADPPENWTETAGGYFADEILQKASRYTKHEVIFENMTASNVAWPNKDEKWSVYVARLMADEAKRRNNSSSA